MEQKQIGRRMFEGQCKRARTVVDCNFNRFENRGLQSRCQLRRIGNQNVFRCTKGEIALLFGWLLGHFAIARFRAAALLCGKLLQELRAGETPCYQGEDQTRDENH